MIKFPKPLSRGDVVAVTAPSAGVPAMLHARLDLAIEALRTRGFRVVEGACLRANVQHVSAPRERRAAELMRFLLDPNVAAVMPPWGGEFAIELLPLLDFDALARVPPKWLTGFSDISTLQLPLLLCSGWASVHGPNLMELVPAQTNETTAAVWRVLGGGIGEDGIIQSSTTSYQGTPLIDWSEGPDSAFNLTEPTKCRRLDGSSEPISIRGRLVGGCLDTISRLAGSSYGNVSQFSATLPDDEHTLLFLENAELEPCEVARAVVSLKLAGWFDRASGILIGRSDGPDTGTDQSSEYLASLHLALDGLGLPVLYDLDIGHRPPQWSLWQGAMACVAFANERVTLRQWRDA
jgi:muramoyltetrapeptide carboxypeptidase LdcA involved in peptidoglycan recycling